MNSDGLEDEREFLLSLAETLGALRDQTAKLSRRLRAARMAIHAVEESLGGLAEEVRSRAERLESQENESGDLGT